MSTIAADVRYAIRNLRRSRAFAFAAIASIALGVAANAIIFSLLSAFFLRPLPGRAPDRLVRIGATDAGFRYQVVSVPEYDEIRAVATAFADVAAHRFNQVILNLDEAPREVGVEIVSNNYFEVLGVPMAVGGGFAALDPAAGIDPVIVSHALWTTRLDADPNVAGRVIKISGIPMTVAGVTPAGFSGSFAGFDISVWVPLQIHDRVLPNRGSTEQRADRIVNLVARLAPDTDPVAAQTQLDTIAERLRIDHPVLNRNRGLELSRATGVHPAIGRIARAFIGLLQGIVALLLLISCANVANLLLVRATVRRRELAVRQALGAGRGRLAAQLLTESMVLAASGGAAGLLLTWWADRALSRIDLPIGVPIDLQLTMDVRVVAFALFISALTAFVFGLAPAWRGARVDLIEALREERARGAGSRLLRGLVVAQVAVTFVLLIGAGLVVRSLTQMSGLDVGFATDSIFVASGNPGALGYDAGRTRAYWREYRDRVDGRADVEAAALGLFAPMGDRSDRMMIRAQESDASAAAAIGYNFIDERFLEMLGIPLVAGRGFAPTDETGNTEVAIINQTMASNLWPAATALGRQLVIIDRAGTEHLVEVAGIARDVTYSRFGEPPTPFIYLPERQWYRPEMVLHVLTQATRPASWLRETARSVDPEVAIDVVSLRQTISFSFLVHRVLASVFASAGLVGLLIAGVGLFGTVAYATEQRLPEIGIRVAVGADRQRIRRLVLGQGLRTTTIGLALGALTALLTSRLIGSFLYGVGSRDPVTFAAVSVVLLLVGVTAGYVPARRAMQIDPAAILRRE